MNRACGEPKREATHGAAMPASDCLILPDRVRNARPSGKWNNLVKIVHFMNHSRQGNGHVAVAVDLACEQARKGHEVSFVSEAGDFDELLGANGVKRVVLPEASGKLRVLKTAWHLLPALRRIRPDIVNAHMVASALAARMVRPFTGFKLVTTVHNSFDKAAPLMKVGDRVIAVSSAVSDEMQSRGIASSRLRVVTNGTIGGVRRPPFAKEPETLMRPAIATVCGLHSRKGVAYLIDGFDLARRECPEAHLYIVGNGPERANFEARAQATQSADHIHFLGFRDDPRQVLASADIFVLASLRDPCPLVIFEAREMGKPIIASAVDGIPAALGQGSRGVLVPPADAQALATEMVRLLADPQLREDLGQAAKADLYDITVERMSHDTVAVYSDALN
jgi:glycosyltransferase involved in cell wall biosynthesis